MPCRTGEGVLWHSDERRLYWVDIPEAKLFRLDPVSGSVDTFDTGAEVGGFTIHEDGRLLLFMAGGAVKLWSSSGDETVIEGLPDEQGNRFNDVIADPEGRVFCGVMSTAVRAGRLYRLNPDRSITVVLENTGTANGMGFSPDLRCFYFCDSRQETISVFDYIRSTGELSGRRIISGPGQGPGRPDGMTVDAEGSIWSARWDGSGILRMDAQGRVMDSITFPVKKVTSAAFGGDDLTTLYATTAGGQDRDENGQLAGSLFRLEPGVKGRGEFRSRGMM